MTKWTTTKFIATGSLGVLCLVLAIPGAVIQAATGMSYIFGLTNVFVYGLMFTLCCLIIRKFWAATIMGLIYGVIALPLPVLVSAGFVPKILIGAGMGLVADSLFQLLRKKDLPASIIISLGSIWTMAGLMLGFVLLFDIFAPLVQKVVEIFLRPLGFAFLNGFIIFSGLTAYFIYKKLKNTTVVKRIQA